MAFRQGRFTEITVSGVSLSAYCDSVDIDRSAELLETTTFTKTSKTFLPGLQDAKVSLKGKYDPTASTGPTVLLTSLIGASNSTFIQVYPGGAVAGQQVRNFNAFVTDFKESSAVGNVVAFEASLQVDGPITASGI
jgi:hypothetical protein